MLAFFAFIIALQVQTVAPSAAKAVIGKEATVCGVVKSARWASSSNRKPTFLNLDEPYPKQLFTVVIFEEHRAQFTPPPEEQFQDKRICVTGKVEDFRGLPQIVVTQTKQIVIKKAAR